MIKTLKNISIATILLSSISSFAMPADIDQHQCRRAAIDLINNILNTPLNEIGREMQDIQDIKNQYPNNPRCLRNIDRIGYALNNNSTRRLPQVLSNIIDDIKNGRG